MGLSALFASRRNPPSSLIPYLCISIVCPFLSLSFSACSPDPPVSLSDVIRWLRLMSSCLCWRVRIVHWEKERRCPSGGILKYLFVFSRTWCLDLNRCWCQWNLWRRGGPLNSSWTHAETLMSGWTTSFKNLASGQRGFWIEEQGNRWRGRMISVKWSLSFVSLLCNFVELGSFFLLLRVFFLFVFFASVVFRWG